MQKKILMIAGPNGAGKTTMTQELIIDGLMLHEFINADEIAKGLAPLHPESVALAASKLMIRRLKELLEADKNFAFETTASGTNYVKHLQLAKSKKYEIHLTFLWLTSPEEAIKRVAQRVKQGGHSVQDDTVVRRYYAGLKNLLAHYLPLSNLAHILDNSSEKSAKRLIAKKNLDGSMNILDRVTWKKIERSVYER
jgi:predicted ABC-type ATPase